jgi:hypothetical protein
MPISRGGWHWPKPSSTSKKGCAAAGHPAGIRRRRALTEAVVALAPARLALAKARGFDRRGLCRARGFTRQRATAAYRADRAAGGQPASVEAGASPDRYATADGAGSIARAALRRPGAGQDRRHSAR